MQQFYESTLTNLAEAKNEVRARPATALTPQRLSLKTNLKLAKLWLDRHEYGRLTKVRPRRDALLTSGQLIRQLHASIAPKDSDADADADNTRGTILLEIYALEIQMYSEMKDNKKLRAIYEQTLSVRSAVPHPRIMGVIRECGGKMHMYESPCRVAGRALTRCRGVVGRAARSVGGRGAKLTTQPSTRRSRTLMRLSVGTV